MLEWALAGTMAVGASVASDLEIGRAAFGRCAACHAPAEAGVERVGPPLAGLRGRRAGSLAGFAYSRPLARSAIVWTPETLAAFLRDPQATVPGNRMAFSGLDDEAELKALVTFLLDPAAQTALTPYSP